MVLTRSSSKPRSPRSRSKSRASISRSKLPSKPSLAASKPSSSTISSATPPRKRSKRKRIKAVIQSSFNAFPPPQPTLNTNTTATYYELIAESFTTGDNHNHNHGIGSQSALVRAAFILTNLGYLYASIVYLMPSSPLHPSPLLSSSLSLTSICSSRSLNSLFAFLIFLASSTFHTVQCYKCRTHQEVSTCVWWNEVDLACAGSYGLFITVCFFKRNLLMFFPCLLLLVGGGVMKLQGYYKMYFLLHGLWHLTGSAWFLLVVCQEGERLI
ncbi:hypothetical protein TrVE_jg4477 [Triparma verrucosa]|uniref:Uncharacterized protein n=1 Tax=Triparma verrucosa TaxID=1606542 RepID=A0A9W7FDY7_9STRA|nr:hypothetical protein TrVE_jg4477 [Triparma verrucosa]